MLLIRGAEVYAPAYLGKKDVLVSFDRIVRMADTIKPDGEDVTVLDASGKKLVPGFIDQHVHVTGGGGEGGFESRTPELMLSKAVRAGVTTLVGLLGTDGFTKNVDLLVAKVKALTNEGITAYCLTGSYHFPSITLTGSVARDMLYVQEVLGCKLAIADHRGTHPTREEIIRLVSDIRMAALVSGKRGVLHMHVGSDPAGIEPIMDIVRTTDIPVDHFRPTHMGRHQDQAIAFTRMGGYADITAKKALAEYFPELVKEAVPEKLTISSDSNGSMPKWDAAHTRIIGMTVGDMGNLYGSVREMVTGRDMPLPLALSFITKNVAEALSLYPRKGAVAVGSDADLVLLDGNYDVDTVIAKGRIMMSEKQVLVKGTFEE